MPIGIQIKIRVKKKLLTKASSRGNDWIILHIYTITAKKGSHFLAIKLYKNWICTRLEICLLFHVCFTIALPSANSKYTTLSHMMHFHPSISTDYPVYFSCNDIYLFLMAYHLHSVVFWTGDLMTANGNSRPLLTIKNPSSPTDQLPYHYWPTAARVI